MKNLKLLYHLNKKFSVDESVQHLIIHSDKKNVSFVCDGEKLMQLDLESQVARNIFDVFNTVSIEHLALNDEFCIACEGGDVILFNHATDNSEIVSFCDGGIETMAWSPDQEVVAFVTKTQNVVVMSCQYDPINESQLNDEAFGDQEFMALGWGKKETQFHGSAGKEAAKKKEEIIVPNLEEIDKKALITWRADGEYFAVGFLGPLGRMFKVFNKEGALQFTSEKCSGLESPIAWRPSGLWIAIPQALKEKYVIALFEKNGLRHREIELPFKKEDEVVQQLNWSNDSEILVVETFKKDGEKSCLYFYTIGNYHWYIKQYLEYNSRIVSNKWDIKYSEGRTLHVLLEDGNYHIYRADFSIDHSNGFEGENEAVVAVLDGFNVLLTNFKGTAIPPPMCGFTLKSNNLVNKVGFLKNPSDDLDKNAFFTVDFENNLKFYNPCFTPTVVKRINGVEMIANIENIGKETHFCWIREDIFVTSSEKSVKIFKMSLKTNEFSQLHEVPLENVATIENYDENTVLIQLYSGEIYKISIEDGQFEHHLDLPEFCEHVKSIKIKEESKIFSLKNRQSLYLNGTKLQSDVTSFFLSEKYLIFTTIASLKFIDYKTNAVVDERRLERGSKLIIVVPKDSRTVLQLPRGNLEAINPRVLSLCIIADHLDEKEYRKAFDVLRKQRINLNLIVDHNPSIFLDFLKKFVHDINNSNWLNLFLTDLQNQDVCVSMYASNYPKKIELSAPNTNGYSVEDKINYICDKMISVFNEESCKKDFILPLITCYVKKGMLEEALDIIWKLKKESSDEAEGALKYLLYLVDVNELYNVALGMYDFGLVMFVATKSQKDPKEYLPFLNNLKKLDDDYRKYKIDCYLKRFGKAIGNISRCEEEEKFEECLEIVKQHNLYTTAMNCYRGKDLHYKEVCRSYGDYLRTNGKLADASLMYERAGDFQQALASARNVLDWKRCLRLGRLKGNSEEEMKALSLSLIPALEERSQYKEIATILKMFKNDKNSIINTLVKGKLFSQAILEASLEAPDLIESVIKPNFKEHITNQVNGVEEDEKLFLKYKNRLQIVRVEKERRKLEPEEDGHDDDCDLYSDTTSMVSSKYTSSSNRSGKSHKSSKNRRKHERKLLSMKEGNQFEDIALIDALHTLIHLVYSLEKQNNIKSICKTAIELDFDQEGVKLQNSFTHLLHIIKISLEQIWIPEMMVSGQVDNGLNTNFVQAQNELHYSMIKPHQRYKPELTTLEWQFDILK